MLAKACRSTRPKATQLDAQVLSRYSGGGYGNRRRTRKELRDLSIRPGSGVGSARQGHFHHYRQVATSPGIARLDKEYQAILLDNATLAGRAALYRTVPGIGPLTAATLVAHLPELGHWDSKALTSLVGLAPWSRDSGKKQGHRAIRGGRGLVRRALYMCAWAVIRHDSEMRRFYDRLRQRGKPGNVAVVAVMRKILLQLNAVARRGTPWAPQAG